MAPATRVARCPSSPHMDSRPEPYATPPPCIQPAPNLDSGVAMSLPPSVPLLSHIACSFATSLVLEMHIRCCSCLLMYRDVSKVCICGLSFEHILSSGVRVRARVAAPQETYPFGCKQSPAGQARCPHLARHFAGVSKPWELERDNAGRVQRFVTSVHYAHLINESLCAARFDGFRRMGFTLPPRVSTRLRRHQNRRAASQLSQEPPSPIAGETAAVAAHTSDRYLMFNGHRLNATVNPWELARSLRPGLWNGFVQRVR